MAKKSRTLKKIAKLLDRHVDVVARPLRWIGQRTLPIYVLHMMPLALIDAVLRSTRGRTTDVVEAVAPILLTAIVIGIDVPSYFIAYAVPGAAPAVFMMTSADSPPPRVSVLVS